MEKDCLQRLLDEGCTDAEAFLACGFEFWEKGLYERAIEACNKVLEFEPENAKAYFNRGAAQYALDPNAAVTFDFDRAIEINPDFAGSYNDRGCIRYNFGQYEVAISDFDRAIKLAPHNAMSYFNRGLAKFALGQSIEARQDFLCCLRLNDGKEIAERLSDNLYRWSNDYPSPYLVHQLLSTHPYAQGYVTFQTLVVENARHCHSALLWSNYQNTTKSLTDREAVWFSALIHLGMGDPIITYRLLTDLAHKELNDLSILYFYQKTAFEILEPSHEAIFDKAVEAAEIWLRSRGGDIRQWFYAGMIFEEADMTNEALICYQRAGNWWPALIAEARLNNLDVVELDEDFSSGLSIFTIETKPDHWLSYLEHAILFFEFEAEITMFQASGQVFPRFWEIWDVSALVEPLRELQINQIEERLLTFFTEKYSTATAEQKADAGRFDHHFDVKTAFDLLKRSKTLAADLALAIGTSRLPAEVHAAFIEYFYLKKKLPTTEVFYLFFYLVRCRGGETSESLLAGTQEAQKSLLENLLKPSLTFLGFFGDAAAAGIAEFLKTLFWQLMEKQPSMLGKPGEATAYEKFKQEFKGHIFETMERLGGEEAFFKQYPIGDFLGTNN